MGNSTGEPLINPSASCRTVSKAKWPIAATASSKRVGVGLRVEEAQIRDRRVEVVCQVRGNAPGSKSRRAKSERGILVPYRGP